MKFIVPFLLLGLSAGAQKLTGKVDVFLGTGGHGHVYPGATVPFGKVQLSPDNGVEGWDWCSGYHYSSDSIAGFSHTHLSGTGIGDWCDVSVMPHIRPEAEKQKFSHTQENGRPGYYQVRLQNGIQAELTASSHTGYHRYHFPAGPVYLSFDMGFRINWDQPTQSMLENENDSTLTGYRFSTGWAKNQRVFFAARFSRPVLKNSMTGTGPSIKTTLQFAPSTVPLTVRVAISSVSTEAALRILAEEGYKPFDDVALEADRLWEMELAKLKVKADRETETKIYTALYRTCLAPVEYSDPDGQYRTHQNQVYLSKGRRYTVFSLWDTFRALHPLFTFTQTQRLPDLINSMLDFYDQNGLLPVWDLSTWETNTMTGYHAIPVLAEAIQKKISGFDVTKAYKAMMASGEQKQRGSGEYRRFGYLPQDKHGWSVTITLEYAYDDWCIAQTARSLGYEADYEKYRKRSLSYQQLFDPATGFMRARDSTGKFITPFDPLRSEHGFEGQYVEGTAWQHSFFVPHDVDGLARLHGSSQKLEAKIDSMFEASSELHGEDVSADVSGLIGQYAHGNEPSHHIVYMYTLLGAQEKAARRLKQVCDSMYKSGPDGLSGNDDCGQMSAWYVWTAALGMYPVNPASGNYVFGWPLSSETCMQLPNGKKLWVVQRKKPATVGGKIKMRWNGKEIKTQISHETLLKGGKLEFIW